MPRSARSLRIAALLAAAAAAASAAAAERKVLIIGVDGMRPDAMLAANCPNFDALIATGAFSPVAQAEDITISGPCWSSILCGVHRNKHGVTGNSFAGSNYAQYPHFFRRLEDACDIQTASIVNWSPVNTNILLGAADTIITGVNDAGVAANCVTLLQAPDTADVIFLHFDSVDGAGHANGFSPTVQNYLNAIQTIDGYVGQIRAALQARTLIASEDWLIIVTSDHGGTPDGSHGQNIPEHRNTPLIISGAATLQGSTVAGTPELVDIPPTVLTFLGLPIDPAWGWDGQARGLNMPAATSNPFNCQQPPPPPVGACCAADATCTQRTASDCVNARGFWQGLGVACAPAQCPTLTTIFAENFDALPLGPGLDEVPVGANVWTNTAPVGWLIDNSALPAGGVREWRGWSFAAPAWWSQVAGDQNRSQFTKARGAAAIADPDEWDDLPRSTGFYNTRLSTPAIALANIRPEPARLVFDSSWRPEGAQAATLTVTYDNGSPVTLFTWSSNSASPNFKADATNETVIVPLAPPVGAHTARFTFSLTDAGNNWWWAIDNIELLAEPVETRVTLLSENFNALTLGPSLNETPAGAAVWTQTPPPGWILDDSGVPTVNNPASGMKEWEGWAFTDKTWWATVAADQNRSQFVLGQNVIAVADPDEWDDRGSPAPSTLGPYNARMQTPTLRFRGVKPGSIRVAFDSSWRPEDLQRARLTATFSRGTPVTLLNWESAAGPNFKPAATNESLALSLVNPPGVDTLRLDFDLLDARNNWWWAIDNLAVTAVASCPCDYTNDSDVTVQDIFTFLGAWFAGPSGGTGDMNADGAYTVQDIFDFLACFFAPSGC